MKSPICRYFSLQESVSTLSAGFGQVSWLCYLGDYVLDLGRILFVNNKAQAPLRYQGLIVVIKYKPLVNVDSTVVVFILDSFQCFYYSG